MALDDHAGRPASSPADPAPSLVAWRPEDGTDYLAVIEREIGGLLRELAEAKLQLTEAQREHHTQAQRLLLSLIALSEEWDDVFKQIETKRDLVTPQMRIWLGNFSVRHKRLRHLLEEQGVVPLELVDDRFDPQWHSAAELVEDPTKPDGTIVDVITRGYLWQGELLRRAEVVVTRGQPAAAEPETDASDAQAGDSRHAA